MFSPVASTIFAFRNAEKTKNGDVGRSVVTVGQGVGVLKEVAKYDNIFAAGAKGALDAFNSMAKENKALNYAGKCLKFTADNVNPLICASGVLKVAMSDDKIHDGIVEAVASVMKGIAFVMGSIGSYALAQKVGEKYANNVTNALGLERKEKINQKI